MREMGRALPKCDMPAAKTSRQAYISHGTAFD
jgi:hypothetical protein